MKRVLLFNPYGTEPGGVTNSPLGFLYLAGTLLKHGFEVKVVARCIDRRDAVKLAIQEFRPDMIGITCLTPGRKKVLDVAQMQQKVRNYRPFYKRIASRIKDLFKGKIRRKWIFSK